MYKQVVPNGGQWGFDIADGLLVVPYGVSCLEFEWNSCFVGKKEVGEKDPCDAQSQCEKENI